METGKNLYDLAIAVTNNLPGIISALGTIVTVVLAFFIKKDVEDVKLTTNGLKNELVTVTRSDAEQQGHTKGVKDEKQRVADKIVEKLVAAEVIAEVAGEDKQLIITSSGNESALNKK